MALKCIHDTALTLLMLARIRLNGLQKISEIWRYIMDRIIKFLRDEEGANAIEYALIAAGIAVVIALALTPIGARITVIFGNILTALGG